MHMADRAQQALQYTASSASDAVAVVSNWGQGYVRADLTGGVPSKFVVDANAMLPGQGTVSTQGTGSIGIVDVLLVPDGGSTVSRTGNPATIERQQLEIHTYKA